MAGDPELGKRIRRHREARRLTQEELADALGVSKKSVGHWETGKHHPRNALGALEDLWGIDLAQPAPEADPVLVAIEESPRLSAGSKEVLRGTYRNLLRDDDARREGAS